MLLTSKLTRNRQSRFRRSVKGEHTLRKEQRLTQLLKPFHQNGEPDSFQTVMNGNREGPANSNHEESKAKATIFDEVNLDFSKAIAKAKGELKGKERGHGPIWRCWRAKRVVESWSACVAAQ